MPQQATLFLAILLSLCSAIWRYLKGHYYCFKFCLRTCNYRMKEATARIKINKLLENAGWRFFANRNGPANIELEPNVKLIPFSGLFYAPLMD
jgi:hypothetical protein